MSFNPLAPEIHICAQPTKSGHGVTIGKKESTGRIRAIITHKSSRGNYGFNLDLTFNAVFTDIMRGDDNIQFKSITVNEASTWFDRTSRMETVNYELGDDDRALIMPAIKAMIKDKIKENNIKTHLPASVFYVAVKEEGDIKATKVVQHLVIDFETDAYEVNLNDGVADGGVTILIDGDISFLTKFKATYGQYYVPASFTNGKLVAAKKDELINIKITDLEFMDFENIKEEAYAVKASDVLLIKKLIIKQIKEQHKADAYPIGSQHLVIG